MLKYNSAFKLEVVGNYGDGYHSYRDVGLRFGLDYSMVRRWVASHAEPGWRACLGSTAITTRISGYLSLIGCGRMACVRPLAAGLFDIRSVGCLSVWERQYERGGL